MLEQIEAERDGGRAVRAEYRMLARDGRVVWVRDEAAIVRDGSGEPLYVQGYLLDVSERRRSEGQKEQLRAAERAALAESRTKQRKLDFLAQACSVIASSPDYDVTLRRVAELAVQDLADWCFVDVVDDDGNATRPGRRARRAGQPAEVRPGLPARSRGRRGRPAAAERRCPTPGSARRCSPAGARSAR